MQRGNHKSNVTKWGGEGGSEYRILGHFLGIVGFPDEFFMIPGFPEVLFKIFPELNISLSILLLQLLFDTNSNRISCKIRF